MDNSKAAAFSPITGLTKREYFAAAAMQGIISGIHSDKQAWSDVSELAATKGVSIDEYVAQSAIQFADAALSNLEKTT